MNRPSILHRLNTLIRAEWQHLTAITPSDRRWQMPFAGALASALPLVVGAFFGHLGYGLISSVGGLVFLYQPHTALSHRMVWLMACAFGMTACYALGLIAHFLPLQARHKVCKPFRHRYIFLRTKNLLRLLLFSSFR